MDLLLRAPPVALGITTIDPEARVAFPTPVPPPGLLTCPDPLRTVVVPLVLSVVDVTTMIVPDVLEWVWVESKVELNVPNPPVPTSTGPPTPAAKTHLCLASSPTHPIPSQESVLVRTLSTKPPCDTVLTGIFPPAQEHYTIQTPLALYLPDEGAEAGVVFRPALLSSA